MSSDIRRRRAVAVAKYLLVVVLCLVVAARCRPHRPATLAAPDTTVEVAALVVAPSTVPATTTRARSTTTVKPSTTGPAGQAQAAAVAVEFVKAWCLQGDVDARRAAVAPWASASYGEAVAVTDPSLVPAAASVTVQSATANDMTAAVVVNVDGTVVRVDLVATSDPHGWRAVGHAPV